MEKVGACGISMYVSYCVVSKYRYRILKGEVGKHVEETIKQLCEWKKVGVKEMNVQEDHVHMVVSIPPKVSISELMGILKVKTAIKLFKSYPGLKRKPYIGGIISGAEDIA